MTTSERLPLAAAADRVHVAPRELRRALAFAQAVRVGTVTVRAPGTPSTSAPDPDLEIDAASRGGGKGAR